MKKTVVIIPARMESGRFPGKPMAKLFGRPLVEWTWMAAMQCKLAGIVNYVLVTSPDREVLRHIEGLGGMIRPSSDLHPNGTARCREVAQCFRMPHGQQYAVINWQVDCPLVQPRDISSLVNSTIWDTPIKTLIYSINEQQAYNPHVVKCAMSRYPDSDNTGSSIAVAHWFTRAALPGAFGHCGIYYFRSVNEIPKAHTSPFSSLEDLEQLAWLETGHTITPIFCSGDLPLSVNLPEDLEAMNTETVETQLRKLLDGFNSFRSIKPAGDL